MGMGLLGLVVSHDTSTTTRRLRLSPAAAIDSGEMKDGILDVR